jgi:hypothetical protein
MVCRHDIRATGGYKGKHHQRRGANPQIFRARPDGAYLNEADANEANFQQSFWVRII